MGLRITTNLLSLGVQRNLATTTRALERSMQCLSSGQRINTGRDDPAGLAMASGLEAQRRGLIQAVRNINDSRGFLETADGAMAEQTNMTQRMRELAVEASNGTLDSNSLKYLDAECQALLAEFTRLATQTQFNGINLLDGSFITTNIQVGHQKGQTISVSLAGMLASEVFTTSNTVTTPSSTSANGTFQARTTVATGSAPESVIAVDVNGDGILDLVSADYSSNTASILLGNGNGTFQTRTTVATGTSPYPVIAADVNGDGILDLISPDGSSNTASIFLGNGNGTFKTRTTLATGLEPTSVVAKDVNGDGILDLVSCDDGSNTASIFLGNGNGTFKTRTTVATGSFPLSVIAADTNGDGIPDLVSADIFGSSASIFLGNGNGTFKTRTTVKTGTYPFTVIAADLNGDGILDLVTADAFSGTASIFLGNGNGTFITRTTVKPGSYPYSVIAVDVNGDGILDLISADAHSNTTSIFLGNGNGTFKTRTTIATGSQPLRVVAKDVNGDGILDLVSADNLSNTASILLGNSTTTPANSITTVSPAVISLLTQTSAQNTLAYLDTGLAYINFARANVGALSSRLDFATSVNLNTIENISSARSQIMDTDMAAETAEFARLQILQKAGIAVLGQANMNSSLSLKLLNNL